MTINEIKQDAEKAMNVLIVQPEVNGTKKITIIGHSEGALIAARVAVDNPAKVKNIVLIGAPAQNILISCVFCNDPSKITYNNKSLWPLRYRAYKELGV
jgi:pimeloyl-ACP methyl ester carboxylesterase